MLKTLSVFAVLDNGKVRDHNEDNFYRSDLDSSVDPSLGQLFFAVDGVGGNKGGDHASYIACQQLPKHFFEPRRKNTNLNQRLLEAIDLTHDDIVAAGYSNSAHREMSCTLVAWVSTGSETAIASLGDSRIYRFRAGKLKQLTTDHSMVQEQIDLGILTPAQAENHPNRNVVTRSLGGVERNQPDVRPIALLEGDRFLLCSDGLHGPIPNGGLADLMGQEKPIDKIVRDAIVLANENGGPDNIVGVGIQIGNFGNITLQDCDLNGQSQPIGMVYTGPTQRKRRWRIWPWS